MVKDFKYWVYGLTLTYSFLFFSIFSIIGIEYEGASKSNIYIFGAVFMSLMSSTIGLYSIISSRYINRQGFFFLILPLLITTIYLIEGPNTDFAFRVYSTFIIIVYPNVIIGIDLAFSKSLEKIYNVLIFCSIVIFLAMIRLIPGLISSRLNDLVSIFGGGNTQSMSYTISFAYMVLLVIISRFKKPTNVILTSSVYIALIVLMFTAILAGGRGAFLVIIFSSIVFSLKSIGKKTIFPALLLAVVFYFVYNYLVSELGIRFIESTVRLFSYIGESGINLEGASHRDLFYSKAIDLISQNIFFGHGIFRYLIKTGEFYSHNIFLDILVQGGVLFMLLSIYVMFRFFMKLYKIMKYDKKNSIILIFTIYSFTFLLFSGTYLNESFFAFSMAYVFSYSLKSNV